MKNTNITLALLGVFLISMLNSVQAQDDTVDYGSNQALLEGGITSLVTLNNRNKKAVGSPYLYKDFASARISSTENTVYEARYNAFNDEIEIKVGEGNIQNFNKNMDDIYITFVNDNAIYTSINYINDDNEVLRGYFVSLTKSNENVKLFSKKQIRFVEAKPAVTGYDKDKPAEFKIMNDTYYIKIGNEDAKELPSNKKDIAKLFPDNSKDVLNFIKKNKLKTSREADLVQIVNYLNTL